MDAPLPSPRTRQPSAPLRRKPQTKTSFTVSLKCCDIPLEFHGYPPGARRVTDLARPRLRLRLRACLGCLGLGVGCSGLPVRCGGEGKRVVGESSPLAAMQVGRWALSWKLSREKSLYGVHCIPMSRRYHNVDSAGAHALAPNLVAQ
jgi:hypothetical protein